MLMQRAIGEFALMTDSPGSPPDYMIELAEEPIIDRAWLIIAEPYADDEA